MYSKRFLMALISAGLLSFTMAGCGDEGNENPCDGKRKGDACGSGMICNEQLKCVNKPAEDPCKGKKKDDPCGTNKVCNEQLKCVDKPAEDPCKGKMKDDPCGENRVCNEQLKCVDKKSPAKLIKSLASHEPSKISNEALASFVKGQYDLNFELIRASNSLGNKNAMISVFSIQTALGMVWAGADNSTKTEMASALHFSEDAHSALNKINTQILSLNKKAIVAESPSGRSADEQVIRTSNNLYYKADAYKWSEAWKDLLAKNYNAGIWEMDFAANTEAARKYINDVVSEDTRDRIKDLIPEGAITNETRSVLTNAIYFKSPWEDKITVSESKLPFHKADNSTVDVDALHTDAYYGYLAAEGYKAVSLPLRDNDFNVLFILPDDGKFDAIQKKLDGEMVLKIINDAKVTRVDLNFPSIEYATSVSLKESLELLGMKVPFSQKADFSKMTTDPNDLYISEIYHKSFIAMNEKGVEAAAATAVVVAGNSHEEPVKLDLDKPYYYVIYEHKTHAPLFVGRVTDPSAK